LLSSSALGQDGVHPNLLPVEIDDTIEILNIKLDRKHLYVDLTLILIIVKQSVCSDIHCCETICMLWY